MTQQKKKQTENQEKQENPGPTQMKGLKLVPINWDTWRHRKLKREAWSNDTTKKEANRKSRKTGKSRSNSDEGEIFMKINKVL